MASTKIKSVGDVRAGRVEQGIVKPAVLVDAEEFHIDNDVLSSGICIAGRWSRAL